MLEFDRLRWLAMGPAPPALVLCSRRGGPRHSRRRVAPPLGFENIAQAIAAAVPTAISTTASTALIVTPSRNVPSCA